MKVPKVEREDSAAKTWLEVPLRLLMDVHNAMPAGAVKRRLQIFIRDYQLGGVSRPWLEGLYFDKKGRLQHDAEQAQFALAHAKSGTYSKSAIDDLEDARSRLELVADYETRRRDMLARGVRPKGTPAVAPPVDRSALHPKLETVLTRLASLQVSPAMLPAPDAASGQPQLPPTKVPRRGRKKRA